MHARTLSNWRSSINIPGLFLPCRILEIYQLVLAAFLFVSPWLFVFAHGPRRIDT